MTRSSPIALFATLIALCLLASCTSAGPSKGRACCGKKSPSAKSNYNEPPTRSTDELGSLASLDESLQPLIDGFNADKGKIRVLALLSPTCSGCVYAALGVANSVGGEYPDADISVIVVWEPMLPGDNYAGALKSSKIFDDPRVRQYWDPNRRSGVAMSRVVMPKEARDRALAKAADNPRMAYLIAFYSRPSEKTPFWDVAFFFERDAIWGAGAPEPKEWIKQTLFYDDGRADGYTGEFWRDDVAQPAFLGDWFVELSRGMQRMTGAQPIETGLGMRPGLSLPAVASYMKGNPCSTSGSAKCKKPCGAKPIAQNIVVKERTPVVKSTKRGCCSKKNAAKGAFQGSVEYKRQTPVSDRDVELNKPMKNSTGKEPTQRSSNENKKPAGSSTELDSLADSLEPLREHFNANKDKLRFVTLLSPT